MKRLVRSATGEILVFTDANILLAPDLVERLLPYYGDPTVGGVSCTIKSMIAAGSLTQQSRFAPIPRSTTSCKCSSPGPEMSWALRGALQRAAGTVPGLPGYGPR